MISRESFWVKIAVSFSISSSSEGFSYLQTKKHIFSCFCVAGVLTLSSCRDPCPRPAWWAPRGLADHSLGLRASGKKCLLSSEQLGAPGKQQIISTCNRMERRRTSFPLALQEERGSVTIHFNTLADLPSAQVQAVTAAFQTHLRLPVGPLSVLVESMGGEDSGHSLLPSPQRACLLPRERAIDVFANSVSPCQLVTHSYPALGDRRVPQGPQALSQQEETAVILAKGQNVPERKGTATSEQKPAAPRPPPPTPQKATAPGMFSQTPCRGWRHALYLNWRTW